MKALTNPQAFYEIHASNVSFQNITINFRMREYLSGYGFKGTREEAQSLFNIRDNQTAN